MQRFFAEADFNFDKVAKYLLSLFTDPNEKVFLTMDRTNWQYGTKDINILMVGAVYKGIAIPIVWEILDKRGNSNTAERINIINRIISYFGQERIAGILADREFIGKEWFKYLENLKVPFVIRIKANTLVPNARGEATTVSNLFRELRPGEFRKLDGKRHVWDTDLFLSALRLDDGELLILASNQDQMCPLELYKRRWEIETLFSCFKGRGFNFEDTRITKTKRINRMVAVLALAFCWAHKCGEWKIDNVAKIRIKKHGRPEKSIFRYGLDAIIEAIFSLPKNPISWLNLLNLLQPIRSQ
jgi:transposase